MWRAKLTSLSICLTVAAGGVSSFAQISDLDPSDPEYGESGTPEGAGADDPRNEAQPAKDADALETGMTSYVLEVVGAHEYWRFKDAKEKIQAQFPEGIEMNISKISRGRVVYALRARAEREELLRRLGGLPLRRGQLAIVATNDHSIRVEIQ